MNLVDFLKEDPEWVELNDLKECAKCHKELPLSEFSIASGGAYRRSECKECSRKAQKQIKELKVPDPPIDHKCPICLRNETECRGQGGKFLGPWVRDHDHKTGKFRGYLCHPCNRGIGAFKDDKERLKRLLDYLESFERSLNNGEV